MSHAPNVTSLNDAKELVAHANIALTDIKAAYEDALSAQSVSPNLLIAIKNMCENLRSALDFAATHVHEEYCSKDLKPKSAKASFPYAKVDVNRIDYENTLTKKFAGLKANRPDIYALLLSVQHFGSRGFTWLPVFMEINDFNKHQHLTPQTRQVTKELWIGSNGTGIKIAEGGQIILEGDASLSTGDTILRGAQIINTHQLPVIEVGTAEILTWVSFNFEYKNTPVLPLLTMAASGIHDIVAGMSL